MTRTALLVLSLLATPAWPEARDATAPGPADTDANIVTAIDGSESVAGAQMRLQLAGLAAAIRAPEFLAAVRSGRAGRVAVAVFVWHDGQFTVTPWAIIGDEHDADAVARSIEARIPVRLDDEARQATRRFSGRLTDLSRALDHAGRLLDAAPFAGTRRVVNVIGNGRDNMGEAAFAARDRLLAAGATVNGVAVGPDPDVAAYYREEVAGGRAAFVVAAEADAEMTGLMRMKLLADLVADAR